MGITIKLSPKSTDFCSKRVVLPYHIAQVKNMKLNVALCFAEVC